MSPTSSRLNWTTVGICMVLVGLVLLVYDQTFTFEFVSYDDDAYVYGNKAVIEGLSFHGVVQAFARKEFGLWSPLVTISHMLDCQLFGLRAGSHHRTSVLLHAASAVLLFLALRQMTQAFWRCAFVAALFAVHPLRVESVAWISERKDVLSGLFFMLTLYAYGRYVRNPKSIGRFVMVVVWFAMGLMSKPMVVTLPFVLLLLDYWPLQRLFPATPSAGGFAKINWRVILEKIPLLALSVTLSVATMLTPEGPDPFAESREFVPFLTRLAEAPLSVIVYLRQMIWPAGLVPIYTHPERTLPWWPAALALLVALSVMSYLLRRKYPYLLTGWLWNLGMLVPVSGIVQISRHAQADHYNYLPQIGLYLGLTWLLVDWIGTWQYRRVALGAMALVVLSACSVAAYRQTSFWRDSITFWTWAAESTQDNYIAYSNLGGALFKAGRVEEAAAQTRKALQIQPAFAEARWNLGTALLKLGKIEEAIAQQREVLRSDPGTARSRPFFSEAHYNLGNLLRQQGRMKEAIAEYREALRIDPRRVDAQYNLGNALLQEGPREEAITVLKRALELQPGNAEIQNSLAWALATAPEASLRDGATAVQLATQASQSSGNMNPFILDTLAAAYAAAGDFPKAAQTAEHAKQLAEATGNGSLAAGLNQRLLLYQAGQSFTDSH